MKNPTSLEYENNALKGALGLSDAQPWPFICGQRGKAEDGLPEAVEICLTPGSDVVAIYQRVWK